MKKILYKNNTERHLANPKYHHFDQPKIQTLCILNLVIYKLTCPACNAEYIGKTDRCLRVRLDEHNSDHTCAMFLHLQSCKAFKFLFSLNNLPGCFNKKADIANFTSYLHQTILNNTTIIAFDNNYNQLCFLESLLMKRYIPQLNYGIKVSKELVLF